jgi:hypothetical protein
MSEIALSSSGAPALAAFSSQQMLSTFNFTLSKTLSSLVLLVNSFSPSRDFLTRMHSPADRLISRG